MKKDKRLIPYGYYCYSEKGNCSYWSIRKGKPKMKNGYCAFLEKGDWDINAEKVWTARRRNKKGKYVEVAKGTADELGLIGSLLWDQVKECGLKEKITKTGPSAIAGRIGKEKMNSEKIIREIRRRRKNLKEATYDHGQRDNYCYGGEQTLMWLLDWIKEEEKKEKQHERKKEI